MKRMRPSATTGIERDSAVQSAAGATTDIAAAVAIRCDKFGQMLQPFLGMTLGIGFEDQDFAR